MRYLARAREKEFPRFVAFFGPDGAGKTTQARLLIGDIAAEGYKVRLAWVRSVHTLAFLIWNIFRKLGLCYQQSNIPMQGLSRPAISYLREEAYGAVSPISMTPPVLNGRVSRVIWSLIEVISVIPVLLTQVYMPLLRGYYVVAERYIVDSVVTISYFLGDPDFTKSRLSKLLFTFVPKGTVFVYVDASYDAIVARRGSVAGPYEYTQFHRRHYEELASVVHAIYLNTSHQATEETHQKLLNLILNKQKV